MLWSWDVLPTARSFVSHCVMSGEWWWPAGGAWAFPRLIAAIRGGERYGGGSWMGGRKGKDWPPKERSALIRHWVSFGWLWEFYRWVTVYVWWVTYFWANVQTQFLYLRTIRYDTIGEFNVDWKAEYSALSSTRSQKKKLKQPTPVPL